MKLAELMRIAIRYSFNYRIDYLSSFLSALSTLALILAVSLLIVVLSIMNGFDKEMRDRILSVVPHITIYNKDSQYSSLPKESLLRSHPAIIGVEYFSTFDSLIVHGSKVEAAAVLVFDLDSSAQDIRLLEFVSADGVNNFRNIEESVVIGSAMGRRLKATVGDRITLILPGDKSKGYGSVSVRVAIQGLINTGTQVDESLVIMLTHVPHGKFPRESIQSGINLYIKDVFDAPMISRELFDKLRENPIDVTNWFQTHGNLYSAIQLSRDLVGILLISVVGIAAFNVVASLVLLVIDKRANIAILRTLGVSPAEIGIIFVMIGAIIGIIGVTAGSVIGILLSQLLPAAVHYFENLYGLSLLSTDVYPIDFIPVDVSSGDIFIVGCTTLTMCILATIYPAINAAKVEPASILQNDLV